MNSTLLMATDVAGGVGIVLLGMVLLTDGLKALAGRTLNRILGNFTDTSLKAVLSGTVITSIIQASSATILATVGFVGAGIISFTAAIGVVLGSNLGSTTTGWIVALLGFKFNFSSITLPLICLGALMKLLGSGRKANAGLALAGFGILFVGIDILQAGMKDFSQIIDLSGFAFDSYADRLLLMASGFIMTVILQSSSVALVTTLAALGAGTLSIDQAAILVTGQNMGKTFYGMIGYIGASVSAKRTALVHVFFNLITGIIVFLMISIFIEAITDLCALFGTSEPAILICAFHTGFNMLGIILLLPFKSGISRLMCRIVKEEKSMLTRELDFSVIDVPPTALRIARASINEIFLVIMQVIRDLTIAETPYNQLSRKLDAADSGLREVKRFMAAVTSTPESSALHESHLDIIHSTEHLERLSEACREVDNIRTAGHDQFLRNLTISQMKQFDGVISWLKEEIPVSPLKGVEDVSSLFAHTRKTKREKIISEIACGRIDPDSAFHLLEAMRWVDRIAYHIWRALFHATKR